MTRLSATRLLSLGVFFFVGAALGGEKKTALPFLPFLPSATAIKKVRARCAELFIDYSDKHEHGAWEVSWDLYKMFSNSQVERDREHVALFRESVTTNADFYYLFGRAPLVWKSIPFQRGVHFKYLLDPKAKGKDKALLFVKEPGLFARTDEGMLRIFPYRLNGVLVLRQDRSEEQLRDTTDKLTKHFTKLQFRRDGIMVDFRAQSVDDFIQFYRYLQEQEHVDIFQSRIEGPDKRFSETGMVPPQRLSLDD